MESPGIKKGLELLRNVVWPAVAGNILWAFVTVCVIEEFSFDWLRRAAALLLVGVYLLVAWWRGRSANVSKATKTYFILDFLYATGLAFFAVTTASDGTKHFVAASLSLVVVFGVAAAGHILSIWDPPRPTRQRWAIAGIEVVAVIALVWAIFCRHTVAPLHLTVQFSSIALVVGFLLGSNLYLYRKARRSHAADQAPTGNPGDAIKALADAAEGSAGSAKKAALEAQESAVAAAASAAAAARHAGSAERAANAMQGDGAAPKQP